MTNCVNCGAARRGWRCPYCGTEYRAADFQVAPIAISHELELETLYVTSMDGQGAQVITGARIITTQIDENRISWGDGASMDEQQAMIPGLGEPGPKRRTIYKTPLLMFGRGPVGKTCATCDNHVVRRMGNHYHKCKAWSMSSSSATDIRVRWPACARYVEKKVGGEGA